jgi:uncharacterized protein YkwD
VHRVIAILLLCTISAPALAEPGATDALNAFRAKERRAPVTVSPTLEKAARRHADDMAANGFFSHSGSDGSSVGDRVRAQGYGYCLVAENIAKGQKSLARVMESWANSRGHRKNMLHRDVTEFALVRGRGDIWVMVLARPGC